MTPNKLREAMGADPCVKHEPLCPIPKRGRQMPCSWGHTAIEFADECEACARIFLHALTRPRFAQRHHHSKSRT